MKKTREAWIDNVKIFACVLVALGHLFSSMIPVGILSEGDLYAWFIQTIYFFHVPLFFICSGYLYQKYSHVETIVDWKKNIMNKALILGVPYFAFSTITWALKSIFTSYVNNQIEKGLFESLFIAPMAPYWYLYCLFLLFLITPTFKRNQIAIIGLVIALVMKISSFILTDISIYAISTVLKNEIWFVLGMCLCVIDFRGLFENVRVREKQVGVISGLIFMVLSILVYVENIEFFGMEFLLGLVACTATVMFCRGVFGENKQSARGVFLAEYTLPIFMMHTIFAATLRSALLKMNITNGILHVFFGICISFVGPIIAAMVMKHFKCLNFLLYPGKYVKIK